MAQLEDSLTLVDEDDKVLGSISKFEGHFKVEGRAIEQPHRAFSLFLFNSKNELLLQQRSDKKITFPGLWTNTCCSHPRHVPDEIDLSTDFIGPRRAAVRRTAFEMGINDLSPAQIHCGAKILYYADACESFAEYELDYILFAKVGELAPFETNKDEVKNTQWVGLSDMDDFLGERLSKHGEDITPWFRLLKNRKLYSWWTALIEKGGFPQESGHLEKF